ncbi:MAG TPA: histidine triad nucleotide-binding protein [Methylomirabilota bacterium]|jgi:histidine triad (HIT) family protein|nr:histidine triad nucleotide-binding protein [Methylomirabilota bacterium]
MAACVFCEIVARRNAATIEYEDDELLAFQDIYPKAPVHLLIIPKRHVESVMALAPEDGPLVGRMVLAAKRIGEARGLAERGYRLALHCGPEGGQVVYHLHLHFLAGRREERKVERR